MLPMLQSTEYTNMERLELLIDDMRELTGVHYVCRKVDGALIILKTQPITHLYLDNDLGDDQAMEGYDILCWARDNGCVPPNILIVSDNNVARKRMEDVIHFDLKYKKEGIWWKKT